MSNVFLRIGGFLLDSFSVDDLTGIKIPYVEIFDERDWCGDGSQIYRTSVCNAKKRLDLLGYTSGGARQKFDEWLDIFNYSPRSIKKKKDLSFQNWLILAENRLRSGCIDSYGFEFEDKHDMNIIFFDGYGSLWSLRFILDCMSFDPDMSIEIDFSSLMNCNLIKEMFKPNHSLFDMTSGQIINKCRSIEVFDVGSPFVVMAEGKSDIKILKEALEKLYPEYAGYFVFFDHGLMNSQGSASALVSILKAFATTRAPQKIIALFDNDTAGRKELANLNKSGSDKIPSNILAMCFPDIDSANNYPTLGPAGSQLSNLNGRACSIELYLGESVLRGADNNFVPVRWGGFDKGMGTYQGEIECKDDLQKKFFSIIGKFSSKEEARKNFEDLCSICNLIIKRASEFHVNIVDKTFGSLSEKNTYEKSIYDFEFRSDSD